MEYLSDVALLVISLVNLAMVLATSVMTIRVTKHTRKNRIMAIIILLSFTLVFDVICLAIFVWHGLVDNCKIFVLYFPLVGYFLYDAIQEKNSK